MPKVSVIIPVYNAEKYLRKCLDSVVNQTLRDIEIICVNDGSTDGSFATLEEYAKKDSRIVIINQNNGGLSCARNSGLGITKAEYITFIDSDDWVELNMCEIFYNTIEKKNVDIVIGAVNVIKDDSSDELVEKRANTATQYYDSLNIPRGKYKFGGRFMDFRASAWGKLYKKSIIDKHNFRFPDGLINEDEEWFWYYFSAVKTLYFFDERFYNRLMCADSIMHNLEGRKEKIFDLIYVMENIYDYLAKNKLYAKYKQEYINYFIRQSSNIKIRCDGDDYYIREVTLKLKRLETKIHLRADLLKKSRLTTRFLEKIFYIKNYEGRKIISFFGLKIKAIKRLKK
jgi:glycosyltransferase involved in cell wall biosynthesis